MTPDTNKTADEDAPDFRSLEVDSDVNNDPNREALLDQSFQSFYENIQQQVRAKEDITNVPGESVFDAAIGMDKEPEEEE
ncbi:hypothetical protein [Paenibacillus tyrfis]|uniref:Uncharacterized protein n=1 Tax=Paenibacillus tyrfis TaxID=1501230 RepID=A0A081NXJ6_9BACL|nr:hypothetical protein [Paenibacillus tyrfis]KEQ23169.1 hypothetical protein ET33_17540 [Paenibacillus tyrfis]